MSEPMRIAIAGLGTVGAGVVQIVQDHGALIAQRAGRPIEIACVSARSRDKDRGVDLSGYEWSDDTVALAARDDVDIVVEMIGGDEGPAKTLVETALENGKSVVTANKALLAKHGYALAGLAEGKGAALMYEAAVAGGIPIIKALREGFAANEIRAVYGILNGTCNYILTQMRETERPFDDVLKEAQDKGYAEADPEFDVEGIDAAHKICLLSALAFGVKPQFEDLGIRGISGVTLNDILYAGELGYKIKLLGIARRLDDKVVQMVEPCLVPEHSPIGAVEDVYNAVYVEGDFVDTGLSVGRGAGAGPTASAVVADIIDLARGHSRPVFGVPAATLADGNWTDPGELAGQHYLRLSVIDKPGVLAEIAEIMRDHSISMEAVLQRGHDPDNPVMIVLKTHKVPQANVQKAAAALAALDSVVKTPSVMRIETFT